MKFTRVFIAISLLFAVAAASRPRTPVSASIVARKTQLLNEAVENATPYTSPLEPDLDFLHKFSGLLHNAYFEEYDLNKDGVLDIEEHWLLTHERANQLLVHPYSKKRADRWFVALDLNDDGFLTKEEYVPITSWAMLITQQKMVHVDENH